jgi:hypothetical protein
VIHLKKIQYHGKGQSKNYTKFQLSSATASEQLTASTLLKTVVPDPKPCKI